MLKVGVIVGREWGDFAEVESTVCEVETRPAMMVVLVLGVVVPAEGDFESDEPSMAGSEPVRDDETN